MGHKRFSYVFSTWPLTSSKLRAKFVIMKKIHKICISLYSTLHTGSNALHVVWTCYSIFCNMYYWANGVIEVTGINECKNKILHTYEFFSITMSPMNIMQSRITQNLYILWYQTSMTFKVKVKVLWNLHQYSIYVHYCHIFCITISPSTDLSFPSIFKISRVSN